MILVVAARVMNRQRCLYARHGGRRGRAAGDGESAPARSRSRRACSGSDCGVAAAVAVSGDLSDAPSLGSPCQRRSCSDLPCLARHRHARRARAHQPRIFSLRKSWQCLSQRRIQLDAAAVVSHMRVPRRRRCRARRFAPWRARLYGAQHQHVDAYFTLTPGRQARCRLPGVVCARGRHRHEHLCDIFGGRWCDVVSARCRQRQPCRVGPRPHHRSRVPPALRLLRRERRRACAAIFVYSQPRRRPMTARRGTSEC